jgi:peptidoglycan/LPS O-acetylase OafA/YrhL
MLTVLYYIFKTVPVAVRWQYGLSMYPLIIMTYPLICLLVTAWDHWHSAGLGHFFYQHLNRFFSFLGHHSLELYLVHILVFKALEKLQEKIALPEAIKLLNVAKIPEYFIYTIISIIGAVILKKVVAFLLIKTRTVFA